MMRRAFETVAMDRLRRIGEASLLCLLWVWAGSLLVSLARSPALELWHYTPAHASSGFQCCYYSYL